ncbi:MAG: DinB family protein [Actinobacteria bacterium]|nr:DinB family protein [Actinomycetota bacterium]
MYTPASNDEITGLVNYLDQQLSALRAAAIGLTDEQARMRPCRSALSIGGLIKHVTYGMRGAIDRLGGQGGPLAEGLTESGYEDYLSSFALGDDETAEGALADFDGVRVEYLAAVAATDPSASTVEPPSPWYGIFDARPANARFYLVHQIEEMARHAGHADVIREQIDGVMVPQIELTQAGMAGNDFFQRYVPQPGTLGAGVSA